MHENTTITGNTFRTTDYAIFKRMEGNRSVLAYRVNRIIKSIKNNGYIHNPIIVNENYEVIDGQGRLEALKTLGLPVDYIMVPGIGKKECIALNAYSSPWTINDYINLYREDGNENYSRMSDIISAFPSIPISQKITITTGFSAVPSDIIKTGRLIVTEEMLSQAAVNLRYVLRFISSLRRVKGTTNYYVYAIVFAKKCGVDKERLIDRIESSPLPPAPNIRTALDVVSDIYNKGLKIQSTKIYLNMEYENRMADKYGWYGPKYLDKTE